MFYVLAVVIIISAVYLWLTSIIKITVVQPVRNGKVTDPLLSAKPRWKVIKEEKGWIIGILLGVFIGLLLCNCQAILSVLK